MISTFLNGRQLLFIEITLMQSEIYKELTPGVNIHIALATSAIQRFFEKYNGKMNFLEFKFKAKNTIF